MVGTHSTLIWSKEKTVRYIEEEIKDASNNELERAAEIFLDKQFYNLCIGVDAAEFD